MKLTKQQLVQMIKEAIVKEIEGGWDDIGQQQERNTLITQLTQGLVEDENLRNMFREKLKQTKDVQLLAALKKLNLIIKEKEHLINVLAMKTTPFVNEDDK